MIQKIWEGKYKPNPVRWAEIPENGKDVIQSKWENV
jgi:retron-type reverse transcriptase